MQFLTSDLDTAVAFVIGHVEDEAKRSGTPLDEEQNYLLTHLPTTSQTPTWPDPEFPQLIPRDLVYERLCTLAKAAHLQDLRIRPGAAQEWEFAAAVFQLNRHPMVWILQWAGLKQRRPWWDGLLLIGSSLFVISCPFALAFYVLTKSLSWTWLHWSVFSLGCGIIVVGVYLASRKFRTWQIKHTIESYRSRIGLS